ncbi:MAG: DUF885 domain-containing protein [Bowdeniella nasicola]|nr:DUF885 domain-containing protein [Bowdeniella nasicola]
MNTPQDSPRTPTPLDAIAEQYVLDLAALHPTLATELGLPGFDDQLGDYSPEGHEAIADHTRATLREVEHCEVVDDVDRVTQAAMRERLGVELELYEAGEHLRDLNVIASPPQELRDIFSLAPQETEEDWANIAARMDALPEAIASYAQSLRAGRAAETLPSLRQIEAVIKQADDVADVDSSMFTSLVANASLASGAVPGALHSDLTEAAKHARQAYADLAQFLSEHLAPEAEDEDAVGRERYERFSRAFLGARIDLEETYEWGLERLAAIIAEQQATAEELYGPGTSIEEAMRTLDREPARILTGTEALREWMQRTSDEAIEALGGEHFEIPAPLRTLECCIAPTKTGGIYYTGPSDDFSRPGRMWWSVPDGVTEFTTWREKTTVYHEGVPGHHLQLGQAAYLRDTLNLWRRQFCWVSGHGEGWALYAERLMAQLGYLAEPGDRMGMLDAQRLRAARVVLDIGVHLELDCPPEWGGGRWDATRAWAFLKANANMDEAFLRFELDRYLGWPGQAPSYAVGQRLWTEIREATEAREGAAFDLRAFHGRALRLGSVGLDVLREALAS